MVDITTLDPNTIPPIGGGFPVKTAPTPPLSIQAGKLLDNAPNEVSLGGFFGKVFIGLVVGICIAIIFFAMLAAISGLIGGGEAGAPSAILGVLLASIGFIAGMLGNMGLALLYNLFFSKRYYTLGKMMGLIFMSSMVIFILMIPLYFFFQQDIGTAFTLFGIQIIFSFFITSNLIEFLAQPNYAASSMLGNLFGFMLSIMIYLQLVMGIPQGEVVDKLFLFMIVPPVVGYAIIIAGLGIWDAIYYKLFEWGNNPFYLRSLSELREERQEEEMKKQKENENINVEMS
ncbi:MAG: hypothetical protein LBG52_01985 [Candidatus Peribacteria bacterium]|jgi:hypothetical protein|nr:hypothetical protein [Candidatus Peribacteria bacterium]